MAVVQNSGQRCAAPLDMIHTVPGLAFYEAIGGGTPACVGIVRERLAQMLARPADCLRAVRDKVVRAGRRHAVNPSEK